MLKNPCWRQCVVRRNTRVDAAQHLGLVRLIAGKFSRRKYNIPIEETEEYSYGLYGLMQAVDTFKPEKKNRFSTYAYWCIRNAIIRLYHERRREAEKKEMLFCERSESVESENGKIDHLSDVCSIVQLALDNFPIKKPHDKINRQVVIDYYIKGMNLDQIGANLGVTKERVRQSREAGLEVIRDWLMSEVDVTDFLAT